MGKNKNIAYCGSPIKYSKTECRNKKCVIFGELSNGKLNLEEIPVQPLHDMRIIKGTLRELAENPISDTYDDKTDDYVLPSLRTKIPLPMHFQRLKISIPTLWDLNMSTEKRALK